MIQTPGLKTIILGGAVEVAVGDGFHDVVVEDVGAGLEVGCHQKYQTNQLFAKPSRSAMVRATLRMRS